MRRVNIPRARISRPIAVFVALLFLLSTIPGCSPKPEAKFYVARAANDAAEQWEIYYDGAWHGARTDGVRPPSYARRHILDADNWFLFAGAVDTVARGTPDDPLFRLESWNIVPPIRRLTTPGLPPDTTGLPLMLRDDFTSEMDYTQFTLNVASQMWPRLVRVEHPPRLPVATR